MDFEVPEAADATAPSPAFLALKQFRPAGRGPWADVPDADWNDWHWQLKHRITTVAQLEKFLPTLTREERAGAILAGQSKLAMAIPPTRTARSAGR